MWGGALVPWEASAGEFPSLWWLTCPAVCVLAALRLLPSCRSCGSSVSLGGEDLSCWSCRLSHW